VATYSKALGSNGLAITEAFDEAVADYGVFVLAWIWIFEVIKS
jgi:hypothetical protein